MLVPPPPPGIYIVKSFPTAVALTPEPVQLIKTISLVKILPVYEPVIEAPAAP
jgi:hypothetical protein